MQLQNYFSPTFYFSDLYKLVKIDLLSFLNDTEDLFYFILVFN